jgi:hypothetical protein
MFFNISNITSLSNVAASYWLLALAFGSWLLAFGSEPSALKAIPELRCPAHEVEQAFMPAHKSPKRPGFSR